MRGPRDQKKKARLRAFGRESRGLAALEFALILPILITMLFGMGELSLAVFARSDVTQMASTVADLIAQEQAVASGDLSNVYNAAKMILYPNTGTPTIRVTSVIYNTATGSTTVGKVAWTCTQSGGGTLSPASRAVNSNVTLSTKDSSGASVNEPLLSTGGSVLMAEVAYSYSTPTTMLITGPIQMSDMFYTKPRRVGQITGPSSCP